VPQYKSVLDYGCGWGVFSEMIAYKRSCQVLGIDIDPAAIEIATDIVGESERLSFSHANIVELSDHSYDVVTSMQVLEHTQNPGNYLASCNRVLRSDGHLVISVPNILNPRYILPQLHWNQRRRFERISSATVTDYDKTHQHVQAWDPGTFCRLLATVGFEYRDHEFAEGIPLPRGLYWKTRLPAIRNLSYTMIFTARKVREPQIGSFD
jgi:2-polyprenyl-3-methyl-5-hydroxy-6-metoxy-1,4-benzoquinol methylase